MRLHLHERHTYRNRKLIAAYAKYEVPTIPLKAEAMPTTHMFRYDLSAEEVKLRATPHSHEGIWAQVCVCVCVYVVRLCICAHVCVRICVTCAYAACATSEPNSDLRVQLR